MDLWNPALSHGRHGNSVLLRQFGIGNRYGTEICLSEQLALAVKVFVKLSRTPGHQLDAILQRKKPFGIGACEGMSSTQHPMSDLGEVLSRFLQRINYREPPVLSEVLSLGTFVPLALPTNDISLVSQTGYRLGEVKVELNTSLIG